MSRIKNLTLTSKLWLVFFGAWILFLSGFLESFVQSPGALQLARVRFRLNEKRQEIVKIEELSESLTRSAQALEQNPAAQEREIRKILGYVAENEIVFEF